MKETGKLIKKLEYKGGISQSGNKWEKQDAVIEVPQRNGYTHKVCVTCMGERYEKLSKLQEGQEVTVSYAVEAREWEGKWFNNVNCIDICPAAQAAPAPASQPMVSSVDMEDDGDDLPF